jgi:hypothetical protein
MGRVNWTITDVRGRRIRLTQERLEHSLRTTRLSDELKQARITETLQAPFVIRRSRQDPEAELYYKRYPSPEPMVCVVAVIKGDADAWVLTAYTVKSVKKGEVLWQE